MKNLRRKNGLHNFKQTLRETSKNVCFTSSTMAELQMRYFWPYMGAEVEEYVKTCVMYQMSRDSTKPKIGKLRSL